MYEDELNAKQQVEREYLHRRQGADCETAATPMAMCGQEASGPSKGIGWAIKNMWQGIPVRRRGWNGRGMHIALQVPDLQSKMTQPYVYMKTVDGSLVPWLCSQSDLLANDWEAATIS